MAQLVSLSKGNLKESVEANRNGMDPGTGSTAKDEIPGEVYESVKAIFPKFGFCL